MEAQRPTSELPRSQITTDCIRLTCIFHARDSLSTAEMARRLDISPARATRARRRLEGMNLLTRYGTGQETRYGLRVSPPRLPPDPALSVPDLLAMVLGLRFLSLFGDTDLSQWGADLLSRLRGSAGEAVAARVDEFERRFVLLAEPTREYSQHSGMLDDVITALVHHHVVDLRFEGEALVGFRCHLLVLYRRGFYLVGDTAAAPTLRRLALDRCQNLVRRRGERFTPRPVEPIRAELAESFGIRPAEKVERVRLRFDSRVAKYVRPRRWHPTAILTELGDDVIELEMQTGGIELRRFALEWGDKVEVLEPAWLRAEVIDELQNALQKYSEEKPL